MSNKSSQRNLVEEDPTPPSSPHSITFSLPSYDDAAMEDAWQERVQREGIRLEDEPWYMTLPVGIECRKRKAYYEKVAREDPDPRKAQSAQNKVDWGNLMGEQIIYAASGERKRIGPEAAKAREEQFVRETEALSLRTLQEAGEDNTGDEDAPRKSSLLGEPAVNFCSPLDKTGLWQLLWGRTMLSVMLYCYLTLRESSEKMAHGRFRRELSHWRSGQ
ncbi:Hypothetical protein NCS54_00227400 [Fusarium falciforme]|uniref:Hypothetical protein n=1 Tax=Fusarium falciforme TaxID=195108 RepID=UPI0023012408|nr:Hypothetical protein NCS54_00227400 [Fusarium falciforme]WAO85041.1 Hypothetical protein NCS54_00227400 [Fusarium falciforme]